MTRVPVSADRRAMIAKVHLAQKALGLDDDTYRDVLEQATGHRSAGSCSDAQLSAVLARFRALGWDGPPDGAGKRRSAKSWVRKVWAIWGDLRPLLDNADAATLRRLGTLHAALFDIRTGKCHGPMAFADVPAYPVREEGGKVLIFV